MHTSILKLVYIYNDLLPVLANHVAINVFYLPEDGHMVSQNK
jgi:hypothetical protein